MNSRALTLIVACAFLFCACDTGSLAGGSTSTETGEPVSLTGRVSGGNGQGLSGVIVSLAGTPLSDTTGSDGFYLVSGRVSRQEGHGPDTLRFAVQGQAVGLRVVGSLTDTVSILQVVQRGFLGYLKPNGHTVTRVEGVLTGDDIPAGDSVVATFFHNQMAENYSGFLYFPAPGDSLRTYEVRVNVYGPDGTLLATSPSVPFTSQAGNILIPTIEL